MSQGKGSKQRPRFIPLDQWAKQYAQTFESEPILTPLPDDHPLAQQIRERDPEGQGGGWDVLSA